MCWKGNMHMAHNIFKRWPCCHVNFSSLDPLWCYKTPLTKGYMSIRAGRWESCIKSIPYLLPHTSSWATRHCMCWEHEEVDLGNDHTCTTIEIVGVKDLYSICPQIDPPCWGVSSLVGSSNSKARTCRFMFTRSSVESANSTEESVDAMDDSIIISQRPLLNMFNVCWQIPIGWQESADYWRWLTTSRPCRYWP